MKDWLEKVRELPETSNSEHMQEPKGPGQPSLLQKVGRAGAWLGAGWCPCSWPLPDSEPQAGVPIDWVLSCVPCPLPPCPLPTPLEPPSWTVSLPPLPHGSSKTLRWPGCYVALGQTFTPNMIHIPLFPLQQSTSYWGHLFFPGTGLEAPVVESLVLTTTL